MIELFGKKYQETIQINTICLNFYNALLDLTNYSASVVMILLQYINTILRTFNS